MTRRVRRGDPQRRRYWEEVVRRWREGGRAVRAFCRAEGVRESTFYFWRGRLARRNGRVGQNGTSTPRRPTAPHSTSPHPIASDSATPTASSFRRASWRAGPSTSRRSNPKPSFLPVHVVESRVAEVPSGVEIVVGHGRTVRVAPGFDRQTLADVLAVLEVRPC